MVPGEDTGVVILGVVSIRLRRCFLKVCGAASFFVLAVDADGCLAEGAGHLQTAASGLGSNVAFWHGGFMVRLRQHNSRVRWSNVAYYIVASGLLFHLTRMWILRASVQSRCSAG